MGSVTHSQTTFWMLHHITLSQSAKIPLSVIGMWPLGCCTGLLSLHFLGLEAQHWSFLLDLLKAQFICSDHENMPLKSLTVESKLYDNSTCHSQKWD